MSKITIQISLALALFAVMTWFCGPVEAETISADSYYTWGISGDDLDIPEGSIITEAVLTIQDITNWDNNLHMHLVDNPPLDFVANDDSASEGNFFEDFGGTLTQGQHNLVDGDLVIRFSEINNDDSWAWDVFDSPFRFTLADSTEVSYSSSLLELIDYAGNSTPFGIGFDSDIINYTCEGLTLVLTVESYQGQPSRSQLTFVSNELLELSGLIGHWSMDDNYASPVVTDSSGNGNNGISNRFTSLMHSDGVIDGSLNFNGTSNSINLRSVSALDDLPGADFSVSAWIYEPSTDGKKTIAGVYPQSGIGWLLRTDGEGSSRFVSFWAGHSTSPAKYKTVGGSLATNSWHHIVAAWDASSRTCRIYIDGYEASYSTETSGSGNYNSDAAFDKEIGRMAYDGGVQFFEGAIDDVKVFGKVLSQQDVDELYVDVLGEPANRSPVANAGDDQIVTDTDDNGSEQIALDGSGSTDPDENISTYVWSESASEIATGVNPTVAFGVGTHTITLTVTDSDGLSDTNTVVITVNSPVGEGVLGYWPLDDNSTNNIVIDSSGNVNTGVSVQTTSLMHINGVLDGALYFNGTNDYINLGSSSSMNNLPSHNFTISAWIYDTSRAGKKTIAGVHPQNDTGWLLRTDGTGSSRFVSFWAGYSTTIAKYKTVSGSLTSNSWHHIVTTWDASSLSCRIYIDGYEASYSTETAGSGSYNTDAGFDKEIGRMSLYGGIQFFEGAIDDVRISNELISATEIEQLYHSVMYAAYWPMDDNSASLSVTDNSGNGNTGISANATSLLHTNGVLDGALYFNGTSDYLNFGNPSELNDLPSHDFTISAWIYDTSSAGKKTIAGVHPQNDIGWLLRTDGTGYSRFVSFWAGYSTTIAKYKTVPGSLTSNSWHHIVTTWDASSLSCRIYIDGYEASYSTETAGAGSYNTDAGFDKEIGRMVYGGGIQFFEGAIDDVKIFNNTLSEDAVGNL